MKPKKKIAVIGGDMRALEAGKQLALDCDREVYMYGIDTHAKDFGSIKRAQELEDALLGAQLVLLPIPYFREDGCLNAPLSTRKILLSEVWESAPRDALIAAGMAQGIPECFENVYDYGADEAFAILNAAPSAEGAIAVALRESDITLSGARVLILGAGRIGKMLMHMLKALGSDITVFARSGADRAVCKSFGIKSEDYPALPSALAGADIIFNTVPHIVVSRELLKAAFEGGNAGYQCAKCADRGQGTADGKGGYAEGEGADGKGKCADGKGECADGKGGYAGRVRCQERDILIIDLASSPGGVDRRAADLYGVRLVSALGLPGKFSPRSAGKIIAELVGEKIRQI